MNKSLFKILSTVSLIVLCNVGAAYAEDCTGTLPGANCTLDEDTVAPLTIDSGITLTVGGSVLIGHEIDADDLAGDGDVTTFGTHNITQEADIGSNLSINNLVITDDSVWTTSADIVTDSTGADINLGVADGGETLNFISGGSYIGEIDGNNGDIVNFGSDGAGGTFVTGGQIEAVTLIVTSGELISNNTVGGGIPLGGITIADGASIRQNANITTSGALDVDGTLTIGAGNTLSANTYVADPQSGTIVIEVGREAGATSVGQLSVASGGPIDLSNDTVRINLDTNSQALISETVSNAIVGNTGAAIAPGQFQAESILYDFSLQPNGNNFDLVIVVQTAGALASTENNRAVANSLLTSLANTTSSEINQAQTSVASSPSRQVFNERLESLQPTVDGGFITASLTADNQMNMMAMDRVSTLYNNRVVRPKATQKLVSGSKNLRTGRIIRKKKEYVEPSKGSVWGETYFQAAAQSRKDGIDGFSSTNAGVVFGADTGEMNDNSLLGMAVLAGVSDIDSDNANKTNTEVSSYGVSFYGGTKMSAKTLLSGSLSYVHGVNTTSRKNVGGFDNNNVTADFPTRHLSLNSNLAYKYKTKDNLTITPSLLFDYDYIDIDQYFEEGNTDLALNVDYDSIAMMALGMGVDLDYHYQMASGKSLYPSGYLRYKYDFLNDGVNVRSNYQGDASVRTVTRGFEPQRNIVNLGAAVEADIAKKWKVALGYDLEYRHKYAAHNGKINLVRQF